MKTILTTIFVCATALSFGQESGKATTEEDPGPAIQPLINYIVQNIVTDRPGQCDASSTVGKKVFQLETGGSYFLFEDDIIKNSRTSVNFTGLRYGITPNIEARLISEYSIRKSEIPSINFLDEKGGLESLILGTKFGLTRNKGFLPEMAFVAQFSLPKTGKEAFRANHSIYNLKMCFANGLSEKFTLNYNLGLIGDGQTAYSTATYATALWYSVNNRIGFFGELYGSWREQNKASLLTDFGASYLINYNFQLDLSGGLGISEGTDNWYASVGLSYRFDK